MPSELNRIYQGRVNRVFVEEKNGAPIELEDGDGLLLKHHELYQDAVNYYLVALTAMSSEQSELLGKMRQRLSDIWNDFYRNGEKRPGLKHSIIRSLGKDHPGEVKALEKKDGLELAMKLIIGGNGAPQDVMNSALELIVSKCKGDVVQPGRTYFARLCNSGYSGNWDFDTKALREAAGKRKLTNALVSDDPVAAVQSIIPEMTLGWSGVKTQDGKRFEGDEAKASLKEAIRFFLDAKPEKLGPRVTSYLKERGKSDLELYIKRADELDGISFERNNKADLRLRHATWLLKFFPSAYTIGLLRSILPEKLDKQESDPDNSAPPYEDDPVKLSRGARGYVFSKFTELKIWNTADLAKEESGWRNRFDMAAFCETLKAFNQFHQKTEERNTKREAYSRALEWMDGKSAERKPPVDPESGTDEESDTDGALPVLGGDPRWSALLKLLKKDLAITLEDTDSGQDDESMEDALVEYGLTDRTIRCYRELRKELLKAEENARKKGLDDSALSADLLQTVTAFQGSHQDTIGSATLFRKLTEPTYFCIWHDAPVPGKYTSTDILSDAVRYFDIQREFNRLQEPIMVTLADMRYSRRTSDLRALVYDKSGYQKGFGHVKDNVFAARIARETADGISSVKVRIEYSAPRLRRDGLIGGETSIYASPVLRAFLGEDAPPVQDFKSTSVSLMPDWDRKDRLRILLNFPVKLDVSKLPNEASARFDKQFERQKSNTDWGDVRLLWQSANGKPVTWHKNGQPFDYLSVDLGQRVAAAISRIHVSQQNDARLHAVQLGEIDGHCWYAARTYAGLLRLPGEDSTIIRDGKREKEPSGREGRPATQQETDDALDICKQLIGDDTLLRQYDAVTPVKSFPEQNDKLLIALRRKLWRLKQLKRWSWMLASSGKRERAESELASSEWIRPEDKNLESIRRLELECRQVLPGLLLRIADRILPLRGRKWEWAELPETKSYCLRQTAPGTDDPRKRICGQRGLSMSRIEQLENLRKRCQALNRILMEKPGSAPLGMKQRRELQIPDCCPDILMRMNEMKDQRVNQTANMILAQALGLRLRPHEEDAAKRAENGIHGEYERIPGVQPASFIVLENLSRYRFSQDRAAFENSRLMKWSHRQILAKLKLLCEVFNIPVLEVDAAYSSKFSASGFPGFRAEECGMAELNRMAAGKQYSQGEQKKLLDCIRGQLDAMLAVNSKATVILPRTGGPVFVPFVQAEKTDALLQADVNASFNIGLRGAAHPSNLFLNNRISASRAKKDSTEWKPRSKTFGKQYAIQFAPGAKVDGNGGSFFVIRCSPDLVLKHGCSTESRPRFADAELNGKYPNLLFGSAIWRNLPLQLERCRKINQARMDKLNRSPRKS